jgi:hypothetical protein
VSASRISTENDLGSHRQLPDTALLRKHHNAILSFENDPIVGVFTLL